MQIDKNKVVTLTYDLHRNDANGDLIETVDSNNPFVFLFGVGGLLPEFEGNLAGKTAGQYFEFGITAANAYGEADETAVQYVPKDIFVIDGVLAEDLLVQDSFVNLRDNEGNLVRARISNVGESEVLLDFNHPLAGQDLFFAGQILEVREATEEEIAHGHVHGQGGHHH
ncbi:MAG: peptidylprolyl isomerase [Chitinophagales bacterium]